VKSCDVEAENGWLSAINSSEIIKNKMEGLDAEGHYVTPTERKGAITTGLKKESKKSKLGGIPSCRRGNHFENSPRRKKCHAMVLDTNETSFIGPC